MPFVAANQTPVPARNNAKIVSVFAAMVLSSIFFFNSRLHMNYYKLYCVCYGSSSVWRISPVTISLGFWMRLISSCCCICLVASADDSSTRSPPVVLEDW